MGWIRRLFARRKHEKQPEMCKLSACPMGLCTTVHLGDDGCGVCIGPPQNAPEGYEVSEEGYIIVERTTEEIHRATRWLVAQKRAEMAFERAQGS